MKDVEQLLKDIDEQLEQGVTDPVDLLERSSKIIKDLHLKALRAEAPCVACGHIPGTGSGVGPMGMK